MHPLRTSFAACSLVALSSTVLHAQAIRESQKITAFDADTRDYFGFSADAYNGLIAIGSSGDDDNGISSGAVYLYSTENGKLVSKISPEFINQGESFGYSVSTHDHTIIGIPNAGPHRRGSALVIDHNTGEILRQVWGSDISNPNYIWRFSVFGTAVAAHKGAFVVGGPECCDDANVDYRGAIWVFTFNDETQKYEHAAFIRPNDITYNDHFGTSVEIAGNLVIAGSTGDDDYGSSSGSAYIFEYTSGLPGYGLRRFKLNANDAAPRDRFGSSVAIDNNIAVVGARTDDEIEQDSGSVYIFDTQTGQQIAKLSSPNPTRNGFFGNSVAIVKNPTFP